MQAEGKERKTTVCLQTALVHKRLKFYLLVFKDKESLPGKINNQGMIFLYTKYKSSKNTVDE